LNTASGQDFNGDGIQDWVVGAPGTNSGVGQAYIVYGNTTGLSSSFNISALGSRPFSGMVLRGTVGDAYSNYIGYSVAGAGDVNGDALADILVAAYGRSTTARGVAHMVYGTNTSAAYLSSELDLSTLDGQDGFTMVSSENAGSPVSSAGDVNGDGYADFLIGSYDAGSVSQGYAYLLYGNSTENMPSSLVDLEADLGTPGGPNGVIFAGGLFEEAGYSVAGNFDINGDGLGDLAVGAPSGGTVGDSNGEVYVVFGQ
ncbi:unnamed protein product, partial [Discosporangium mesarthrocarpum]